MHVCTRQNNYLLNNIPIDTSDTRLYKKQCRTTDEDLSMLDLKKTTTRMHRVYHGVVRDFVYDQCMVKEESPMDSDPSHLKLRHRAKKKKPIML